MSPEVSTLHSEVQRQNAHPEWSEFLAIEGIADREAPGYTDTPHVVSLRREPAGNDATYNELTLSMYDLEPCASHALAANGFGDIATATWPTSYEFDRAASRDRALILGNIVSAAILAVRAIARRVRARHRQRQQAKATCDVLRELDDRMLRDLGFHRSDLTSWIRDSTGTEAYGRAPAFWTSQGPPR